MKPWMIPGLALFAAATTAMAATTPVWENKSDYDMSLTTGPQYAPVVDATAFINQALFQISTYELPFDTQNTLYFTNKTSGNMVGYPGFRLDFTTNDLNGVSHRYPAAVFHNQGRIYGDLKLLISASNIVSPGVLGVGVGGLVRLEGENLNLARGIVRAGANPELAQNESYLGVDLGGTYYNVRGVTDFYWGAGSDGSVGTNGAKLRLDMLSANNFSPPSVYTPAHQVLSLGTGGVRPAPTATYLPEYYTGSDMRYQAYVYTNWLSPTSTVVQMVFLPTNNIYASNSTVSTQVRFAYGGYLGYEAVPQVEFSAPYYDRISQTSGVYTLYFADYSAWAAPTNFVNSYGLNPDTEELTGTRRPLVYDLTATPPTTWAASALPNMDFTNVTFYGPNFLTNSVHYYYAAYSALVNSTNMDPYAVSTSGGSGGTTALANITNVPGRVEIVAGQLDLSQARIRGENFLSIKATNLVGNRMAIVDAPVLNYDLGSTNSALVISNLTARTFPRLKGQIYAWSAVWETPVLTTNLVVTIDTNFLLVTNLVFTTNLTRYHALVMDYALNCDNPVLLNEFAAHATNVVISDPLLIGRRFAVDAEGLSFTASGTNVAGVTFPAGQGWWPADFPRLAHFTNQGNISFPLDGRFFLSVPTNDAYGQPVSLDLPYLDWINSGTITGASHIVRAGNLLNSGIIQAAAGSLEFWTTNTALYSGHVAAQSDVSLQGVSLVADHSTVDAGGLLALNYTGRLADTGPGADNVWSVSDGFLMGATPAGGDLLGTRIISRAAQNALINHVWAGRNLGAVTAGFSNNAALGHLILDGQDLSLFHFAGVGTNDALYVDYLEFRNYATNIQSALAVEPNLTIYFANANISPDKLNGALRGRLRWVYAYAGANSSTNVLVDGRLFTMNSALLQSAFSDLDADGTPNKVDATPLLSGSSLNLRVNYVRTPSLAAQISWDAIRYSTNWVEFRTNLAGGDWFTLTNIVQGSANARLMVLDPVKLNGSQKYYRVRVSPYLGLGQP